jgi:chemotaxis signal transduction protein
MTVATQHLIARVRASWIALPVRDLAEILRPLPLLEAPHDTLGGLVRGVAIVRGLATPVLDTARLVDGQPATRVGHWLRVAVGPGRFVALEVERAERVVNHLEDAGAWPSLMGQDHPIARLMRYETALVALLASSRILSEGAHAALVGTAREARP